MKFAQSRRLAGVAAVSLAVMAALAAFARPAAAQFSAKSGPITLTLTIPDGVTKLRGILAFTATGLGPSMAKGADFMALAKKLNVGIVQVGGGDEFGDASYPTRCQNGAFKPVLEAMTALAATSKHPELAFAPIAGHGHSHGGDFWNYFNACYPERMAYVFCKSSGGVQYLKGALRTPMIWEIGTNDLKDSRGVFRGAMLAHREAGTAMSLVLGPGETHGGFTPGSRQMVIDLAEAVFNLRVPAEVDASTAAVQLYDIDEKKYLLGDNYTKEYTTWEASPDKETLSKTSFLPNEDVAKKWQAYGEKLPAGIMVEKGGHCTTCYKTPAAEPDAKPNNAGPPPGGGGGTPDAGAPSDAGTSTPSDPPDAAPVPTPPSSDPTASGGSGGAGGASSSSPPPSSGAGGNSNPAPSSATGGSNGSSSSSDSDTDAPTGGCSYAPAASDSALLLMVALALLTTLTRKRHRQ